MLWSQTGPEGAVPREPGRQVDQGAAEEPRAESPLLQPVPNHGRGDGAGQGQGEIWQAVFFRGE